LPSSGGLGGGEQAYNVDAHARLLNGLNRERAAQNVALRGIWPGQLKSVDDQEPGLAVLQARASRITSIIPMFIIRAVLFGAAPRTFNCPHQRPGEG
jgi:hypothetical protein